MYLLELRSLIPLSFTERLVLHLELKIVLLFAQHFNCIIFYNCTNHLELHIWRRTAQLCMLLL